MSKACLVRGSINIDEIYTLPHIVRPGETIASTGYDQKTGGKGSNQAYAAARAGGRVVLDAQIGADGLAVRDRIAAGGVDVSRVRVVEDEVTGRAIIQRSNEGENSIVLHAGANFANPGAKPELDGFTHLLLQNEIPLEDTLAYLREAGRRGLTTIYNPSPMPTREQLRAFPWSCLTHLIVNEGELADIATAFDAAPTEGSVAETARAQMHALSRAEGFNPSIVIVTTIGPEGVLVLDPRKGETLAWPAAPVSKVVDTTGAGDTFAGYFVSLLMEKGDDAPLDAIIPICLTACALTVETAGAMESIAARKDVDARVAR
ncbi:putative ATP binding protein [Cutaneotrichosporon oleaginosum]|uniref:Ribokinase n=1 Tax=Cutaneotrichosporon oleaginosum TaxID=879819 RepID=A0A0J0XIV9_9TREE|nr:putative ATP binding protein [Cutaneotrichosporon oleaginosum]KLT41035.1 putative ATP binding protein [Cutaneotrichosporon oleaginosum]TXT12127.1 hypothetical protein COLE_02537 [Cutaneotrichosporon oleaginosum]